MHHAIDPDHVAAVTTIVGCERTILHAVIIVGFWAFGTPIAILGVGSAITLKLTIPTGVGLSSRPDADFLGILNSTGMTRKAIEWSASHPYTARSFDDFA